MNPNLRMPRKLFCRIGLQLAQQRTAIVEIDKKGALHIGQTYPQSTESHFGFPQPTLRRHSGHAASQRRGTVARNRFGASFMFER